MTELQQAIDAVSIMLMKVLDSDDVQDIIDELNDMPEPPWDLAEQDPEAYLAQNKAFEDEHDRLTREVTLQALLDTIRDLVTGIPAP